MKSAIYTLLAIGLMITIASVQKSWTINDFLGCSSFKIGNDYKTCLRNCYFVNKNCSWVAPKNRALNQGCTERCQQWHHPVTIVDPRLGKMQFH